MNDKQYRAFLDLLICCDPWPVEKNAKENLSIIFDLANEEAEKRGFVNWVAALHDHITDYIEYTEEQSSNVWKISYSTQDQTMDVTFRNGKQYRYFDVPLEVYRLTYESKSIGSFMSKSIKGAFRYSGIEGDQ